MPESQPLRLQAADLIGLAPPGLLQEAEDYYRLGRVQDPVCWQGVLYAQVQGSDEVHAVQVTPGGDALCSCRSRRRYCRHVLAVLYLWVEQPEAFVPLEPLLAHAESLPLEARSQLLGKLLTETWRGGEAIAWLRAHVASAAKPKGPLQDLNEAEPLAAGRWRPRLEAALEAGDIDLPEAAPQLAKFLVLVLASDPEAVRDPLFQTALAALRRHPPADVTPEEAAELVLRLAPADWVNTMRLTRWLLADGASAAELAQQLWRLASDAPARYWAARLHAYALVQQGRPDQAAALWQLCEDLPHADEQRVRHLLQAEAWNEAVLAAERGLRRAPEREVPWFRRQLGRALLAAGRAKEAVPYWASNFSQQPTWRLYQDLRQVALQAGVWPQLAPEAIAVWRQRGDWRHLARALTQEGRHQEAATVLEEALAAVSPHRWLQWQAWLELAAAIGEALPLSGVRLALAGLRRFQEQRRQREQGRKAARLRRDIHYQAAFASALRLRQRALVWATGRGARALAAELSAALPDAADGRSPGES